MSLIITFQLVLFSQFFHRALGNKWSVTYNQEHLCALKGSTVFMNGSYTEKALFTVKTAFWLIDPVQGKVLTLYNESGYLGRVEYSGDKQKHFSLRLSDVKKTDEHQYCIRVLGERSTDKYLFYPGVRLNVTALRVEIPEKAVEGNRTVLVCNTTCRLSDTPVFIWYRNNLRIDTIKNSINNTLILQPTKADASGSYSCAVEGHEEHRSPARNLTVMYPPKNVSVSISPSGEIVEDSSVTLTCSSDANPPVKIYTWFKGMTLIGNEKTYNISKMSVEERGEYKCKCSNEVGHQYSIGVPLDIGASDVSVIVYVSVGVGLFGLTALLSALFWLRWKRRKKKTVEAIYQNAGPSAKDDTYAALDPTGRTSDDVYHTLAVRVS